MNCVPLVEQQHGQQHNGLSIIKPDGNHSISSEIITSSCINNKIVFSHKQELMISEFID